MNKDSAIATHNETIQQVNKQLEGQSDYMETLERQLKEARAQGR